MPDNLYTPDSIRTVSGRYVNILELDPDTIHIEDIAHSLANTPRFGGHLPFFYSVGQHSIFVHHHCLGMSRELRLQALMHDASEYLMGDMPSPIKKHLPDFQDLEDRIMRVIAKKYGFPWPIHPDVKAMDRRMLESEWEYIMLKKAPSFHFILDADTISTYFIELFSKLTA